jgi:hypothetical protein
MKFVLTEAKNVYARVGKKITKAFRCTAGKRKGKTVKNPTDCFKRKNIKLARKMKVVNKRTKHVRARHAAITNKTAAHKILTKLNKN